MRSRLSALWPIAWVVATGCVGESPVSVHRAQEIAGGMPDAVDSNIVSVVSTNGSGSEICSGSLIAPNLVLTARHCVSFVPEEAVWCQMFTDRDGAMRVATLTMEPYPAGSFLVTTNQSLRRPRDAGGAPIVHFVQRVIVPPDSTGVELCGRDIALLELADNVPLAEAVPLVPRLDMPPFISERYTAIGYGGTDDNGTGVGQRRFLSGLSVMAVGELTTNPPLSVVIEAEQEWAGDHGVCGGDSGGPALSSHGEVLGAVSRGSMGCETPVYTRVDSYADLIRQTAAQAAHDGNYAPPFWVAANAVNSIPIGSACLADSDCLDGNEACLYPSDGAPRRLCLVIDCTRCPAGYACGVTDGSQACLPLVPASDAGVLVDVTALDVTLAHDAAIDAADAFVPPDVRAVGGCDARPRTPGRERGWLAAMAMAMAAAASVAARGRRRRLLR